MFCRSTFFLLLQTGKWIHFLKLLLLWNVWIWQSHSKGGVLHVGNISGIFGKNIIVLQTSLNVNKGSGPTFSTFIWWVPKKSRARTCSTPIKGTLSKSDINMKWRSLKKKICFPKFEDCSQKIKSAMDILSYTLVEKLYHIGNFLKNLLKPQDDETNNSPFESF